MADTAVSLLSDNLLRIGDVFTPLKWGEFAVREFGLFDKWMGGATVFDPTMGEGNLLEALIKLGLKQGVPISELPTENLFGNELNTRHYETALQKFNTQFGLDMSSNFTNCDLLSLTEKKYDLVFGNPPWQNFVDLPEGYKKRIKKDFLKYDLVGSRQALLLGGSRIDLAALIIQRSIADFLMPKGEGVFFMPLSLLLNDGANRHFRTFRVGSTDFSVEKVFDFNDEDVFGGIATRYCLAHFKRDTKITYPVDFKRIKEGKWADFAASPVFHPTDPWSITSGDERDAIDAMEPIVLKQESTPRQGVNTCGANDVFFFEACVSEDEKHFRLTSKEGIESVLPKKYVFPLVVTKDFKEDNTQPSKWVLLPYHPNGKALSWSDIERDPALRDYLLLHKTALENRKGTMLNANMKRGFWWALLGVGEYNFFPFKIIWEAYGKAQFRPRIFSGRWQANQSLQAFIPLKTLEEAKRVLALLNNKCVEDYLLSLKMEGTMNWAQPGKIKKLIRFEEEELTLF
jgi:hypothetical protein